MADTNPTTHLFADDGTFPNSRLPVLLYRAAFAGAGQLLKLEAGDALVIPAGVAHKNEGASGDFRVVGAYPDGTGPDMQYGRPGERPASDRNIAGVPLPGGDPVHGREGPLLRLWKRSA